MLPIFAKRTALFRSLLKLKSRSILSALICLLTCAPVAVYFAARSVKSSAKSNLVTVRAAGRGEPYLHLRDGRQLQLEYQGDMRLAQALRSNQAEPRSLATADLNGDAAPDLVAGYAYGSMGIVTIQPGNTDAYAPRDDSVFARMQQGYNPDSLMPTAETYLVPEPVDFLQVGDFNHDNQRDILVAASGGGAFLLPGDGRGGFGAPEQIALPGTVTSLTAGEFRAPDGWTDLAVAVNGPAGPELVIYDGVDGVAGEPMHLHLSAPATAVELGEVDSSPFMGIVVATGSQIEIVHGWGRKQSPTLQSRVEVVDSSVNARGLAIGSFVWSRAGSKQIAALGEDGTIHILARGELNTHAFSDAENLVRARARASQTRNQVDVEALAGWQAGAAEQWATAREVVTGNVVGANATAQNLLQRAHISFMSTDDLLVLSANQQKLDIVRQVDTSAGAQTNSLKASGDMVTASLNTIAAPVTAMALPQKLNGERSLLVLQAGSDAPTVVRIAPTATITVNRTDDPAVTTAGVGAAACTGAANDCSLRGAVFFANANSGTVISLGAHTYTLNTNGTGGCVTGESLTTGNQIGDLESNTTTTFTGAGQASTIINQIGTGNGAHPGDRVLCMDVNLTAGFTYNISGLTMVGGRDVNSNVGGGAIIGGARNTPLTLTNVTFVNNQSTGPNVSGGGAVAVTGGDMTVTNCTFGAANLPGASRTDLTLGNAVNSNSGGGLSYSPGDPLGIGGATGTFTMTGTTFTHNTSSGVGGGGADFFNFNTSTGTANISTTAFTSNQANGTGSGGGFQNESFTVNVSTTSFTSNSALNRGGGIYVGGGSVLLDGTNPSVTFTGNTAPNNPTSSSASTASAVNVAGTNMTIGGSIEISAGGVWTNNTGSTLNPTDIDIVGGTLTCNNSTMNVSGNLTLGPSGNGLVGGTFNGNTGTVNLAGNLTTDTGGSGPSPSFNGNTGTFNFNGSAAQSISGTLTPTFNNLTDSNTTQPLTASISFPVGGTLNVNGANAIFAPAAGAIISGGGTLTGTGTARVTRTAATADFLSQYTITNKTLTSLTVEYNGGAAQTGNALTYGGLKINNGSGVTLAAGTTNVNGTLTLASGALAVGTNTLNINAGSSVGSGSLTSSTTGTVSYGQGSNGQSVIAANYGNLTFSGFSKVLPSGTVGVANVFTPGAGTGHTITGNTFDFNGAGNQTVPQFTYNNLTISGARGANSVTLVNGGVIGVAGTFNPSATFGGGGFVIANNAMDFNGTGAQTVAAPFNYHNLTISGNRGGAAITLASGNIGVASTFNPSATNNTWVNTGNTIIFNGTATQTAPAFDFFGGLTLNNNTGANLGGNVTVNAALTLTSGTLGVAANTLTLNGAVSATAGTLSSGTTGTVNYNQGSNGQATVLAANYGNLTFSNFNKTLASSGTIGIAGTFTPGTGAAHTITGSTINFNGASPQTIPAFTYNNLTSSSGATARTLDPLNTIKIAGAFTPGSNTYTITGSTIEYNGTSAQTLPSSGFNTYNNLTLNNAAGTAGFAGLTVNGLIEVKAGIFTSASTYNNVQIDSGATLAAVAASTINVSGNWTNNGGTFTASTSTVNLNGAGAQTIGGTGTTTFNNLTVSNSNAINMSNDNTVNGVLALTSSDINVASGKTLTQPSTAGASTGTFDVVGAIKRTGAPLPNTTLTYGNLNNTIGFIAAGTHPTDITVNLTKSAPTAAITGQAFSGWPGAVARTYLISQNGGVGFSATMQLHYNAGDLNGNTAGSLKLWKFITVPSAAWQQQVGSTDNGSGVGVSVSGLGSFSPWTLANSSPTAAPASIGGSITDASGVPVSGATINLSGTDSRETITDANGNYSFDNVGANGFYTVTPSRVNYTFSPANRSFSSLGAHTDASFTASGNGDHANAIDTTEFFVRQQYLDFLGREPDPPGFAGWVSTINNCASGDTSCDRVHVSEAFFRSQEFQERGYFVYRFYSTAFGQKPDYAAFVPDLGRVSGFLDATQLEAAKTRFANDFTNRSAFVNQYGQMNNAQYVDALSQTAGVTLSNRQTLVDALEQGTLTRGQVLRQIAEGGEVYARYYNQAFVVMEYFGYLRRDPDSLYLNWISVLDANPADSRRMVEGFVDAAEYRNRFKQ